MRRKHQHIAGLLCVIGIVAACSGDDGGADAPLDEGSGGSASGSGGSTSAGGGTSAGGRASTGGAGQTGGTSSSGGDGAGGDGAGGDGAGGDGAGGEGAGGEGIGPDGGHDDAGADGAVPDGGDASSQSAGGASSNGGSQSAGGASSGGASSGGASSGGASSGGASSGGASSGGASSGGASSGGASSGGASSGGASSGGASSGGASSGGASSGGASSGGASSGGASSGGASSGGAQGAGGSGPSCPEGIPVMCGIVAAHNAVRAAAPGASPGLPELVWDEALAAHAQGWANTCPSVHNPDRDVGGQTAGENIYWSSSNTAVASSRPVDLWASEGLDYEIGPNTCAGAVHSINNFGCGHYTQIVWRSTVKVGCGMRTGCGGGRAQPWVCNYLGAGNFYNQSTGAINRPY